MIVSNVSYINKSKEKKENSDTSKQSEVHFRTFNNLGKYVKKINNFM